MTPKSCMLALLLLALAACVPMLMGCSIQDQLLYYPDRYSRSVLTARSARVGLRAWPSVEAYRGLLVQESLASAKGTLAIFHGNAGSAMDRIYYGDFLVPLGFRIILLEYPGYGAREGKPGEATLVADGAESLRMIHEQYGGPVYVLGESLGATVAAGAIAGSSVVVDGLVLCTPWDDLTTVAKGLYPFLPVQAFIRDRYDSVGHLKSYGGPLAVILADRDELVPRRSSERLFESYPGPKRLWVLRSTHNTWLGSTNRQWWRAVFQFLDKESIRS